ncbi:S-protein homolog 1-like [Ziziphus jujuba]|uniref:S-protein homolog 1-like n=1 Tax=Ziziphus jujuba TaxID=326968 RepID=A0ABM4AFP8_ZIZJJ|nr:S-protein homolog 1-like [Ziziphus jujuba]
MLGCKTSRVLNAKTTSCVLNERREAEIASSRIEKKNKIRYDVLILFLAIVISFRHVRCEQNGFLARYDIQVVNGLSGDQDLFIHCKSKDDDLGEHNLAVGDQFRCAFKNYIWIAKDDGVYLKNIPKNSYELVYNWE